MERKQWLETFLNLADKGAPTVEYRKKLRLKINVLPRHVKSIPAYRKELQVIYDQEKQYEEAKLKKQQKLEQGLARARKAQETREKAAKEQEPETRWEDDGGAIA